jgi:hypothetical protein
MPPAALRTINMPPQRRQPRPPPLPRNNSRKTGPARLRERAGVRAKWPLCLFCLSHSTLSCSTLSASGRGGIGRTVCQTSACIVFVDRCFTIGELDRSRFVVCPSERVAPDECPVERTQRSALPPSDCRVHSNGYLRLDVQRLKNSEFDSARAHSVRSTSCGPDGAQEGSRGFRDSGTPGQPSPTRPEPRQGFQRARHHALLIVSCPPPSGRRRVRTIGFQPVGPRANGPPSPPSTDIARPKGTNHWGQNPQSAHSQTSRGEGRESAPERGLPCLLSTFSTLLSRPPAAGPPCPPAAHSSAKPRPNGQRTRWGRKPPHVIQSKDTARSTIHRHPPSPLSPVLTRDRATLNRCSAPILNIRGMSLQDPAWVDPLGRWPTNHDLPLKGRWAKPIQICSLPIGTGNSRRMPSGADTEVRPPATLSLAPGGRGAWMDAQRTGSAPIEISSLPIGTGVSRRTPSGADTEVRPPAMQVFVGRERLVVGTGCPLIPPAGQPASTRSVAGRRPGGWFGLIWKGSGGPRSFARNDLKSPQSRTRSPKSVTASSEIVDRKWTSSESEWMRLSGLLPGMTAC